MKCYILVSNYACVMVQFNFVIYSVIVLAFAIKPKTREGCPVIATPRTDRGGGTGLS